MGNVNSGWSSFKSAEATGGADDSGQVAPPEPSAQSQGEPQESGQSAQELDEERRKIRRLQMVVNMVTQVISQDSSIGVEEASEMVADVRRLALGMFPDKELAFNLIFWPRLQRLMRERYRMQ